MKKYYIRSRYDNCILVEQKTKEACERWIEDNCYEGARGFWYMHYNGEGVYISVE